NFKEFHAPCRANKPLAIDGSTPEDKKSIHRLVRTIDVVVINYRPDVAERLRIDYETLAAIKPDLIYLDNTASGRQGDMADRPGYDIVVQAMAGLISSVGKVDERGVPVVPPPFADTTTAYAVATGVCAALFHRARTGLGQKVETSLLINALTIHLNQFTSVPAADAEQRAAVAGLLARARSEGTGYAAFLAARDAVLRVGGAGNIYYRCFLT